MHEDNWSDIWRPSDYLTCIAWDDRYGRAKDERRTIVWMGPEEATCRVRRRQGLPQREEFLRPWMNMEAEEENEEEDEEEEGAEEEETEKDEWTNVRCQALALVQGWVEDEKGMCGWKKCWKWRLENAWSLRLSEKEESAKLGDNERVKRDLETEERYGLRMKEWCEEISYAKFCGEECCADWSDDWRIVVEKSESRYSKRQRTETGSVGTGKEE